MDRNDHQTSCIPWHTVSTKERIAPVFPVGATAPTAETPASAGQFTDAKHDKPVTKSTFETGSA